MLSANKFGTGEPATWAEGDWDAAPEISFTNSPPSGDGVFDVGDLLAALGANLFNKGSYIDLDSDNALLAAADDAQMTVVPEPSTDVLAAMALLSGVGFIAHRRKRVAT